MWVFLMSGFVPNLLFLIRLPMEMMSMNKKEYFETKAEFIHGNMRVSKDMFRYFQHILTTYLFVIKLS